MTLLVGETGSGKSTQLAQIIADLMDEDGEDGLILTVEPRKLACKILAARVAEEMHGRLGAEVGYSTGAASKSGPATRILFMIDWLFLNELVTDRTLRDYKYIVID